jgi:hypothetical protein
MNLRFPITIVAAGGLLAGSAGDLGAQDDPAPPAPVEFTMCGGGTSTVVSGGPEEEVIEEFSLPDGEMTIERGQTTWRSTVTDVSDPRLEGTWYHSADGFTYTLPGGPAFSLSASTRRMENDEGAWQGSGLLVGFPDGSGLPVPYAMVGEGAYEGLTAVMIHFDEDCPNFRGYIIEESVPPPPVPNTGQ